MAQKLTDNKGEMPVRTREADALRIGDYNTIEKLMLKEVSSTPLEPKEKMALKLYRKMVKDGKDVRKFL